MEMTPLYIGVPRLFKDADGAGGAIGGTYVSPSLFGADRIDSQPPNCVAIGRAFTSLFDTNMIMFTLGDLLSVTSSAPVEFALFQYAVAPRLRPWSVENGSVEGSRFRTHGDGGQSDNIGILPLLARRVGKIIVFSNSDGPGVPEEVAGLFGEPQAFFSNWQGTAVFDHDQLSKLRQEYKCLQRDKKPIVIPQHYTVTRDTIAAQDPFNLHLLKDEKYEVDVIWFFLDAEAWKCKLQTEKPKIAEWLRENQSLIHFPHYYTFGENLFYLIKLHSDQVSTVA
jgi:hypothetical protein